MVWCGFHSASRDAMGAATEPFDRDAFLKSLPGRPGVYRMMDAAGQVIYVGKARDLKKRVSSYFRAPEQLAPKTRALMAHMARVEVTTTHTEGEALLLESNLIKDLAPRYNIVLRDDKTYPYIYVTTHQDFPRLGFHRGARSKQGRYFGPYPSAGAVRETLNLLQKLFQVRQCEDTFYRSRSRPCLQHQIKRCTAPCVGLVAREAYAEDVRHALMFLEGKGERVVEELAARMEAAARDLAFEQAARYRDQIAQLQRVQERQYVSAAGGGDLDVVAAVSEHGLACVQVFFIRGGHNLGNKSFFPGQAGEADPATVLRAFLPQFYLVSGGDRAIPPDVLLSHPVEDQETLEELLTRRAGYRVHLRPRVRAERARWVRMALDNGRLAVAQRLAGAAALDRRFAALQEALELDEVPSRLECFDISHTRGESTVASCVVFGREGAVKSDYRRFNIEGVTPGDDYGAMRQALERRYTRLKKEEGKLPDLLLIDGGKGQVAEALAVLEELQLSDLRVVGVAKGAERRPGMERLILPGRRQPLILGPDSAALHLIQQVRDEAHRFAITAHRQRRSRTRTTSPLEGLPGIGPKRRQQLLRHFGGLQGLARAGVEDLSRVPGISRQLAQSIYDAFHAQ